MRALALFIVVACTGCEGLGYGYVNARSSPVRVVREDSGVQRSFTLAARHRLGPFIHDRIPDLVVFYDSRGKKLGSISSATGFRPFGATTILVDDHGVRYTKSADWTQLPQQEPPKFSQ